SDVRRGPAPKKPSDPTGEKKFLRDQQRELFDFIRRQVAEEQMRADTDTVHTAKPLYLAERQTATRLEVAPDARFVLVTVTERAKGDSLEGRQVVLPSWVTQSGYVETQQIRTKVGDAQSRERAALIDVATGKATWIDGPLNATAGWLKDGETVYYGSEETGYAHLYTVPAAGGAVRAFTRGPWEVQQVTLAPDGKTFYLHTNEGDFGQVHCYALDV